MTKSLMTTLALAASLFFAHTASAIPQATQDELNQEALADSIVFGDEDELTPDQIAEELGLELNTPEAYARSQEEFWQAITLQSASGGWVKVNVSLSRQHLSLRTSNGESLETIVSTGKKGHRTPTGCWHVRSMETMHYSSKYNNAPMPYSSFFYGGYAIHGSNGKFDGNPYSHGCVRVPRGTDKKIFTIFKGYSKSNISVCISK